MRLFLSLVGSVVGLILILPAVVPALIFKGMRAFVLGFQAWSEPRVSPKSDLMRYDPVFGWRSKENLDAHLLIEGDDVFPVRTDAEGWPAPGKLEGSEVVVIGDSFASGYGARAGRTFFELASHLRVKPYGCPGYDMVQEFLILQQLGSGLRDKVVVWLLYVENDLPDALRPHWQGYRKPFAMKPAGAEDWAIHSSHLSPQPWTASALPRDMSPLADLCTPGPFADRHYSACGFLLREGARVCREAGARDLILVSVPNVNQLEGAGVQALRALSRDPTSFDPSYPDRRLEELCREQGIRFVPGGSHFQAADYKRFERFHWNPQGHRRMALLLSELVTPRGEEDNAPHAAAQIPPLAKHASRTLRMRQTGPKPPP